MKMTEFDMLQFLNVYHELKTVMPAERIEEFENGMAPILSWIAYRGVKERMHTAPSMLRPLMESVEALYKNVTYKRVKICHNDVACEEKEEDVPA